MSKFPERNLTAAMLQPGRRPAAGTGNVLPMGEMQMLLTLDQLQPNPDNPRTTRNSRYDEIKASIKARGLDSVPKVTKDPDSPDDTYIFSDGGNTRFAILSELWQETGDEKFYRINVVFKPWPGRLQCVIGHLAENEVRGDLTFIEKALGVHRARELYEESHGKLSVRKFAQMLTADGMPLGASSVSRMMNTVDYLWPSMPVLLKSGMGRPQINALLALRQDALELWDEYRESCEAAQSFAEVFGSCCAKFDAPELWQPDVFRDELIGDCLKALPHPDLNYDRWLLALEPRKKAPENDTFSLPSAPPLNPAEDRPLDVGGADETSSSPDLRAAEEQPDLYGGESVFSGNHPSLREESESVATGNTQHSEKKPTEQASAKTQSPPTIGSFGQSCDGDLIPPGTEKKTLSDSPALSMGEMVALDTDIEHLQSQVFRLAWAIADSQGYGDQIIPAREHVKAPGFRLANVTPAPVTLLLISLTGEDISSISLSLNSIQGALFVSLFTGGPAGDESPDLDDENAQCFMQLLMVMRRLRELQRGAMPDDEGSSSDENE
uniref:ParB family protein n=1 Tax=Scandinavium goeteborgense TaxID=1851514 RepID=UPI00135B96F1|nr:ParB family protein [Scandinavium goeteborgense]